MSTAGAWLGLDIGGANLKAANTSGYGKQVAFPLWRQPESLGDAVRQLVDASPRSERLAVTMTGELADCFASKPEGVRAIIDAVEQAADGRVAQYYYLRTGAFVDAAKAKADCVGVAASNWHALAAACGHVVGAPGVLIDVGSTTTDIVRFDQQGPTTQSITDTDRLLAGELLYQGVGRTPVCAVVRSLPLQGHECPVAAELFATVADAARLLGRAEESADCETADGRPATRAFSAARLARMVCADASELSTDEITAVASRVVHALDQHLTDCLSRRLLEDYGLTQQVITSGAGEWLARSAMDKVAPDAPLLSLAALIGDAQSVCAPAWAVAFLAERTEST